MTREKNEFRRKRMLMNRHFLKGLFDGSSHDNVCRIQVLKHAFFGEQI